MVGDAVEDLAQVGSRLLIAEGRVERTEAHAEVPILHLIVRRLLDRTGLLDGLAQRDGDGSAWAERVISRADEVRRPEPGSRQDPVKLPPIRDFR